MNVTSTQPLQGSRCCILQRRRAGRMIFQAISDGSRSLSLQNVIPTGGVKGMASCFLLRLLQFEMAIKLLPQLLSASPIYNPRHKSLRKGASMLPVQNHAVHHRDTSKLQASALASSNCILASSNAKAKNQQSSDLLFLSFPFKATIDLLDTLRRNASSYFFHTSVVCGEQLVPLSITNTSLKSSQPWEFGAPLSSSSSSTWLCHKHEPLCTFSQASDHFCTMLHRSVQVEGYDLGHGQLGHGQHISTYACRCTNKMRKK